MYTVKSFHLGQPGVPLWSVEKHPNSRNYFWDVSVMIRIATMSNSELFSCVVVCDDRSHSCLNGVIDLLQFCFTVNVSISILLGMDKGSIDLYLEVSSYTRGWLTSHINIVAEFSDDIFPQPLILGAVPSSTAIGHFYFDNHVEWVLLALEMPQTSTKMLTPAS